MARSPSSARSAADSTLGHVDGCTDRMWWGCAVGALRVWAYRGFAR